MPRDTVNLRWHIVYINNVYVNIIGAEYIRMSALEIDNGLYTAYNEFWMTFTLVTLVENSNTNIYLYNTVVQW